MNPAVTVYIEIAGLAALRDQQAMLSILLRTVGLYS
jgi:hypothetical protein